MTSQEALFPFVLNKNNIYNWVDGHVLACLGATQYFGMHASVDVRAKMTRTSLGAGATKRSDGAHEDDKGHKSSHSNADDHRHWERLCREQQKDKSF